jgi:hypothetical protein
MRWHVAPLASLFVCLYTAGCLQISTGTGSGQSGDAGSASGSAASDAGPTGAGCVEDPESQVILCAQIDTCPNVTVDPDVYPDCGFRLHDGTALDLECLCAGALCPIGVPTTCDDASRLLGAQSSLIVCQQVAEGRCVALAGGGSDAGSSSSPCSACAAQCGGTPSCFQACGC